MNDYGDQPESGPVGGEVAMPIEHIVIIVKENHTLDNYFGTLPRADGQQLGPAPNPPGPPNPLPRSGPCAITIMLNASNRTMALTIHIRGRLKLISNSIY